MAMANALHVMAAQAKTIPAPKRAEMAPEPVVGGQGKRGSVHLCPLFSIGTIISQQGAFSQELVTHSSK